MLWLKPEFLSRKSFSRELLCCGLSPLQVACKHVQLECLFPAPRCWVGLGGSAKPSWEFLFWKWALTKLLLVGQGFLPPLVRHGLFLLPANRNKCTSVPVSLHRFKRKVDPWKLQIPHVLSFLTKFSSFLIPWEAGGLSWDHRLTWTQGNGVTFLAWPVASCLQHRVLFVWKYCSFQHESVSDHCQS